MIAATAARSAPFRAAATTISSASPRNSSGTDRSHLAACTAIDLGITVPSASAAASTRYSRHNRISSRYSPACPRLTRK